MGRRSVGLLLMLLLANVSVARVAASCEPVTGHAAAAAVAEPVQDHSRHDHSHHEQLPAEPDVPPPDASQCCQAMTSCVSTPDASAVERPESVGPWSARIAVAVAFRPASRIAAPETPPPRA